MSKMTVQEAAMLRMEMADNALLLRDGMNNINQRAGQSYPAMMYRRTDVEERNVQTTTPEGAPKTWLVTNIYAGRLCDTIIAEDATEAEALAEQGWQDSPAAAYGEVEGIGEAVSAKDAEIAALREQLASMQATGEAAPKRGPGRPPKMLASAEEEA